MSSSAAALLAQRVQAEVEAILKQNSATNRSFMNFNPTYFSLTDSAIKTGIFLRDPKVKRLTKLYSKLRKSDLAKEIVDQLNQIDNIEDHILDIFVTLFRKAIIQHGNITDFTTVSDVNRVVSRVTDILNDPKEEELINKTVPKSVKAFDLTHLTKEDRTFVTQYLRAYGVRGSNKEAKAFFESNKGRFAELRKAAGGKGLVNGLIAREFGVKAYSVFQKGQTVSIGVLDSSNVLVGILAFGPGSFGRDDSGGSFNTIKSILKKAVEAINDSNIVDISDKELEAISQVKSSLPLKTSGAQVRIAFDVGHVGESAAFTNSIKASIDYIVNQTTSQSEVDAATPIINILNSFIQKTIKKHEVFSNTLFDVAVDKATAANTDKLEFGSALGIITTIAQHGIFNQQVLGATVEANIQKLLNKTLETYFANMKGSPSVMQHMLNSLIDVLEGNTYKYGSSVQGPTATKRIKSGSRAEGKAKIGKALQSSSAIKTKLAPPIRTSSALNLSGLIAYININLPPQVRSNMGRPKLVNRTGRFSNSTKVLTATRNEKGDLTFNYTYQKAPYETFEPGGDQGSVQRDPRPLIAKSIRDIVTPIVGSKFKFRSIRV